MEKQKTKNSEKKTLEILKAIKNNLEEAFQENNNGNTKKYENFLENLNDLTNNDKLLQVQMALLNLIEYIDDNYDGLVLILANPPE
jgi:hypothetical protein